MANLTIALPKQICVEVLSPGKTKAEIDEKIALFLDAGAKEVWICAESGSMRLLSSTQEAFSSSRPCPDFPRTIQLGCGGIR
jgi:hypothetical protein